MILGKNVNYRLMQLTVAVLVLVLYFASLTVTTEALTTNTNETYSACEYMRRMTSRRSKALGTKIRSPRCASNGSFEPIQCQYEKLNQSCWCVDEYGVEIPHTRSKHREEVQCKEPDHCPASACRMFCPSGFARDEQTGCTLCRCRDPCHDFDCPPGHQCQLTEINCRIEPCPPIPTCKRARSLGNFCPAGQHLTFEGANNMPVLCGLEAGKPKCPPLYKCMVEPGMDYGVCCLMAVNLNKPGTCPSADTENFSSTTGYMCGSACNQDLDCPDMQKCCRTKGCGQNCRTPGNITNCQMARAVSEILSISEREGRGYVPRCEESKGIFAPRQCSRNGLVCWCVNPQTGNKINGTMGAADTVQCDNWRTMIGHGTKGRSFQENVCDTNICAAVCEYGFENDANNCPTCECSDPCNGFRCPQNSYCTVATDPLCESGSSFCSSWPTCIYNSSSLSTYCSDGGNPILHNVTQNILYCLPESSLEEMNVENSNDLSLRTKMQGYDVDGSLLYEEEDKLGIQTRNYIECPRDYKCSLVSSSEMGEGVCCPLPRPDNSNTLFADNRDVLSEYHHQTVEEHQQTMCEYLRDFSDRMEGTEEGMKLAIAPPLCTTEGSYRPRQCHYRTIQVTRAEQRKILEQNTIRRMRILLQNSASPDNSNQTQSGAGRRRRRDTAEQRLRLYRVDDSLLKVQVSSGTASSFSGRNGKVIDVESGKRQQDVAPGGQLFETDFKKVIPAPKKYSDDNEMTDLDVEECWCVDNFGTEIPRTRGFNVTDEHCLQVRTQIDCLDLTCRMGCEYGFILDPESRCPACQCRDPCQNVLCSATEECRVVDVSCDEEYCASVPACLPRKPGQCPYLVPPGTTNNLDVNACSYECRTDSHCEGSKRCCSNGCGTQCVLPQMMTACQHLQHIQMHQSSELGIPVMRMNIAQCDGQTGQWLPVQCAPDGVCWCVDGNGQELSGTRVRYGNPVCSENSSFNCPKRSCTKNDDDCEAGFQMDENGCPTCQCRNYCREINCSTGEECQLISVECVDLPCPKMPICVPRRQSPCPEGNPLHVNGTEVSCGPHTENMTCPSTHTCQLNPVTNRGICCSKTRDICFESLNGPCQASATSKRNVTLYRFSPKANRCVAFNVDMDESAAACPIKNFFQTYDDCKSVCPILTQCERLKLKNILAAQRTGGHSSVWFKPSCDPLTGNWSPVQCLGKQPDLDALNNDTLLTAGAISSSSSSVSVTTGVCWCADKKGAPIKGSLTRDHEPICNSRHGRTLNINSSDSMLMEELIHQIAMLTEMDNFLYDLEFDDDHESPPNAITPNPAIEIESTTKRILELAEQQLSKVKAIQVNTTRCRSIAETATFPVSCDEKDGSFEPMQCNQKFCWCVDSAGNQLQAIPMFERGSYECERQPIGKVVVELYMQNTTTTSEPVQQHLYDIIRGQLKGLLGPQVENVELKSHSDGSILIHFELQHENKIDVAFAIESLVAKGQFKLVDGHFNTDITRSQFIHHRMDTPPVYAKVVSHEGTLQLVLFITASVTALTICLFVVYVMVKRGKEKQCEYPPPYEVSRKSSLSPDSVDFLHSPVFVLSPEHDLESIRPPMGHHFAASQTHSTGY